LSLTDEVLVKNRQFRNLMLTEIPMFKQGTNIVSRLVWK